LPFGALSAEEQIKQWEKARASAPSAPVAPPMPPTGASLDQLNTYLQALQAYQTAASTYNKQPGIPQPIDLDALSKQIAPVQNQIDKENARQQAITDGKNQEKTLRQQAITEGLDISSVAQIDWTQITTAADAQKQIDQLNTAIAALRAAKEAQAVFDMNYKALKQKGCGGSGDVSIIRQRREIAGC